MLECILKRKKYLLVSRAESRIEAEVRNGVDPVENLSKKFF